MTMLLTDYFRSAPDATWEIGRQLGVRYGVIRLPEDSGFDPAERSHWLPVYQRFIDYGITPVIIEPMPNCLHDHIKAGDEKRDESIERVMRMFPIMDELNIRTICFNWMAYVGWTRTRSDYPERGGARVTAFDLKDYKPSDKAISAEQLWDNYAYFLHAVLPEAEKHGIRLALHPDDPPLPKLGEVSRIMISYEAVRHAVQDIVPSENLGVTFCQATFAMMGEDLYDIIPKLAEKYCSSISATRQATNAASTRPSTTTEASTCRGSCGSTGTAVWMCPCGSITSPPWQGRVSGTPGTTPWGAFSPSDI